jgi:hypothetical protein
MKSVLLGIRFVVSLFLLVLAWAPNGAVQAAGTDEIRNYAIDILPQEDGSLVDTYAIQWCVISNAAGPLSWFTLGMPAEQYQILNSGGDAASARPDNENFDHKIRIDLPRDVVAGECIDTSVQIHQYGMAYLDESANEISFQFTPGWFNEIPVDLLRVTWHLPAEESLLKSLDPKPTSQDAGQAVWETDLQPGEKFPITVVYDKAAFPGFTGGQDIPTQASQSEPIPGGSDNTDSPFTSNTEEAGPAIVPGFDLVGIPLTATTCICLCLVTLLVLFVIFVFFRAIAGAGRIYRSGSWLGGYPRRGGWLGGGGVSRPGGGGGSTFTPRTGGGSGAFGGRGMSCACVSSGCACACAGGGRAGCSRKGFDVSSLFKDRQEERGQ